MTPSEKYMSRCLELAKKGAGFVAPNPMVGCVIVLDDKIIGEGYHQKYGQAHAEVNAIHSVKNQALLKKATLYVSLEPCAHFGKTPPCSDLIIQHQIPHVVIGVVDSFKEVNGKGIERLKAAGIRVDVNVLEDACIELNQPFFTYHNKKRPFIELKWAESKDGFIAPESNEPYWLTSKSTKVFTHQRRAQLSGILVGGKTILKDNPALTTRAVTGPSPIRIILEGQTKITKDFNVIKDGLATLIYNKELQQKIGNVEWIKIDPTKLHAVLEDLYNREIQSIIVEGGPTILHSFINENLWDSAYRCIAPKNLKKGIKAPFIAFAPVHETQLEEDLILKYQNKANG